MPDGKSVYVSRYGIDLEFTIGSNVVKSGQKTYEMDVPIVVHKNRSYISLRFLTEFLGGVVKWDAK